MKKSQKFRILVVIMLVVFMTTTAISGYFTVKAVKVGLMMDSLTDESAYYQQTYTHDLDVRDELIRDVNQRRYALKNNTDDFVSWFANKNPFVKLIIFLGLTLISGFQLLMVVVSISYIRDKKKYYWRDIKRCAFTVINSIKNLIIFLFRAIWWIITIICESLFIGVLYAYGKITGDQVIGIYTTEPPKKKDQIIDAENAEDTEKIVPFRNKA